MSATSPAAAMPVVLLDWKPLAKGSLRGFARVKLGATLVINDIPVLISNGRAWASLPSKPLVGKDGVAIRDGSGKQRYAPILEWSIRESSDRFSSAVVDAVRRDYGPNALDVAP
jgi:hypothetical protein